MIDAKDDAGLAAMLPHPCPTDNKYTRGRCILFVGGPAYGGAAVLAARAAQRMGAGYTQVYTAPANELLLRLAAPSAVCGTWSSAVLSSLPDSSPDRPVAYVVGSGFDASDTDTRSITCRVLKAAAPVAVDGGALEVLATRQARALLENRRSDGISTVITPHVGEAARLFRALGHDEMPDEPARLALALSRELGTVTCLKGPLTFISDGQATICMDRGTAVLAKAGTGDVLAGMVGALLAQGLEAADAAVLACRLHAEAGRIAAGALTDIAAVPEDVIDAIPRAIMALDA